MKLALILGLAFTASAAQAADLNCRFKTSLGDVNAILADGGDGTDNITFRIGDKDVGSGGGCRAENSFRRSAVRCPVFIDRDTRLEFYRSAVGREQNVKYSVVLWTNLSSNNPRTENANGTCAE
ncbi:MAG: hypothetical protein EOP11_09820 [Proteobacteria bacterium]|nr:MAG: hypothetical protein EOP11_09820 [Pseudomonadota bacterium]